jgi:ABC-type phosphate/phosphonate transport system substrate-binding protein
VKNLVIGVMLAAFALAGCAGGATSTQQAVEKYLIAAHQTYEALGVTLTAAAQTGLLKGSAATEAKIVYDQVGTDLAEADAAYDAGNATGLTSALAAASADSAKASALIPKH